MAVVLLRRPHADKMHIPERCGLLVGRGEAQPAGVQAVTEQLAQPGLEYRQLTTGQP